jgi:phospholipid/cholesterol/gamma-HCH transport system permease protein
MDEQHGNGAMQRACRRGHSARTPRAKGATLAAGDGGGVDVADQSLDWRVDRSEQGIRLSGRFRTHEAGLILAAVRRATTAAGAVEIDLAGVEHIDGGVAALLGADLVERGVRSRVQSAERFGGLFELCTEGAPPRPRIHTRERIVAHIGRATVDGALGTERLLGFVGELAFGFARLVRRPRGGYWKDIPLLVERSGFDAVPVSLTINFLVGFVLAYMASRSLAVFGANIYVADLVSIGMARQLGPLMTAIIVCGRSGAAFATELGSMKVNEEIDALRTLGLDPFDWLVFPRIIALVLVVPVLTLLADLIGMVGGLLVAVTSLGLTARDYINETRSVLRVWDIESGLIMSVVFAIAIALIACQQGFSASGGPLGVGRRTTSTVVLSLFAIVVLDATLTIAFRALGPS